MQDQVRRMAQNDEPKCKNCKHWFAPMPFVTTIRPCRLNTYTMPDATSSVGRMEFRHTTDLSLCSAWEGK